MNWYLFNYSCFTYSCFAYFRPNSDWAFSWSTNKDIFIMSFCIQIFILQKVQSQRLEIATLWSKVGETGVTKMGVAEQGISKLCWINNLLPKMCSYNGEWCTYLNLCTRLKSYKSWETFVWSPKGKHFELASPYGPTKLRYPLHSLPWQIWLVAHHTLFKQSPKLTMTDTAYKVSNLIRGAYTFP